MRLLKRRSPGRELGRRPPLAVPAEATLHQHGQEQRAGGRRRSPSSATWRLGRDVISRCWRCPAAASASSTSIGWRSVSAPGVRHPAAAIANSTAPPSSCANVLRGPAPGSPPAAAGWSPLTALPVHRMRGRARSASPTRGRPLGASLRGWKGRGMTCRCACARPRPGASDHGGHDVTDGRLSRPAGGVARMLTLEGLLLFRNRLP